jgi:ribosome-binding factor A
VPNTFDRQIRIADQIKHEIGRLLLKESRDPRFSLVSVTAVEVSKDYSHAQVFVTLLNDQDKQVVIKALNKAAGFFRFQLAHSLNLRTTPRLHFHYDDTLRQGQKIIELLAKK